MSARAYRLQLRPPNAANSYEEFLQVYNLDLRDMSLCELLSAEYQAARIAELYPRNIMWRGMRRLSVSAWADERIGICERLRSELLGSEMARPPRKRPRAKPWM